MAITIRPELEAKLRARAEAAGTSVETYLERIAHNDQAAELELEALAIEGLHSGESIEAGGTILGRQAREPSQPSPEISRSVAAS